MKATNHLAAKLCPVLFILVLTCTAATHLKAQSNTGVSVYQYRHVPDGKIDEFVLPISQSDLAGWLGVSRGRLNRTLINFQKLGLIRQDGSRFFILDRQRLMQLSEGVIVNAL